jgi:hypothetical protein
MTVVRASDPFGSPQKKPGGADSGLYSIAIKSLLQHAVNAQLSLEFQIAHYLKLIHPLFYFAGGAFSTGAGGSSLVAHF